MSYGAVAGGEPFAGFFRCVIERTDPAAIGDAAALIDDVNAFRPRGVGIIGGVGHVVDTEGQTEFESLHEIIRDRHTLFECFRLCVADVIFILQIRFHLPLVGGMRFANVNGQKIGAILVVFVDLNDVANLAAKWRSGKTAEDQNQRTVMGSLADVETTDAVEGDDACVRRVAADFQRAAMHVRQGIAHHAVRVLGASGHVGQSSESGDEKHAEYSRRPFPETIQWKLFSVYLAACGKNSIIRGRLSSAACPALFCSAPAHSR